MKRISIKNRRWSNALSWLSYFIEKYGENPSCSVCSLDLEWFNNSKISVVFDHRLEGLESIKGKPSEWLSHNEFSEHNRKIWEDCNFGILCSSCNLRLPSMNRWQWLRNALDYAAESKICV